MDYFKSYNFDVKKEERLLNAFKRLSIEKGWNKNIIKKEKNIFINIVNKTLNEKYNKLEHYQELCTNILNKRPNTITQCKKVLKTIYVNIWDIVDEKYTYFDNYKKFRKYTINGKIFPKDNAKGLNLNIFLKKL